ncbi:hypothetical protein PRNP1_014726 [Phytophthora ramorum]
MVWIYRSKKKEASPSSIPTKTRPQKRAAAALDTPPEPRDAAAALATPPSPHRAVKKTKTSVVGHVPCYRLRSEPVVRHPLIIEAATMQIESMSRFRLAAPASPGSRSTSSSVLVASQASEAASSDPSILAIWSLPSSQTDSLSEARTSGLSTPVSNASTWAPWTPQTPSSSRGRSSPTPVRRDISASFASSRSPSPIQRLSPPARFHAPRTPPGQIPRWFEEAFESEGYDSDAMELIADLKPSCRPRDLDGSLGAAPRDTGIADSVALHESAAVSPVVDCADDAAQDPSEGLLTAISNTCTTSTENRHNDPAPDAAGGTSGAEEAESCGSEAAESDPDDPEADGSGSEAVTNGLESDTAPEDNLLTP